LMMWLSRLEAGGWRLEEKFTGMVSVLLTL